MAPDLVALVSDFALAARELRDAYLASPREEGRGRPAALRPLGPLSGPTAEWRNRAQIAALPYRAALAEADLGLLRSDGERIAFWVNAYNALASLSVVELGVRDRLERQPDFFYRTVMVSGGLRFGLGDIEEGILGGNRRSAFWPFRPFGRRDRRRALAPSEPDVRARFALDSCAASSPSFRVLAVAGLDEALAGALADYATRFFLPDEGARSLVCSRLFVRARGELPGAWLDDPAYAGWRVRVLPWDGRVVPSRQP